MDIQSEYRRNNYRKIKQAWLLTWEWDGDHASVNNKFVTIISSKYSSKSVKRILEEYYLSNILSFYERFSYIKSRKDCPFYVQNLSKPISDNFHKIGSIPPFLLFSDEMIIGDNPYLWARIVYDLETWSDGKGSEFLKWKEPKYNSGDFDKEIPGWRDGILERHQ